MFFRKKDPTEICIGYDARTTAQIIQQMKDEGYLTIDTRSRLVLVDSAEQDKIRHHDYCNPMTLVKLYVSQITIEPTTVLSRVIRSLSDGLLV